MTMAACSSLEMTYDCTPSGATLYKQDGKIFGVCPTTETYDLTEKNVHNDVVYLEGLTAVWPSGAVSSVKKISVDLDNGHRQAFVFRRPTNAPRYDLDWNNALNLKAEARKEAYCRHVGNAAMPALTHTSDSQQKAYADCMEGR
jgi:hypothetical protein